MLYKEARYIDRIINQEVLSVSYGPTLTVRFAVIDWFIVTWYIEATPPGTGAFTEMLAILKQKHNIVIDSVINDRFAAFLEHQGFVCMDHRQYVWLK